MEEGNQKNTQWNKPFQKCKRKYLICAIECITLVLPVAKFSVAIFSAEKKKSSSWAKKYGFILWGHWDRIFELFWVVLKYSGLTTDFKLLMPRAKLNCAGRVVRACPWPLHFQCLRHEWLYQQGGPKLRDDFSPESHLLSRMAPVGVFFIHYIAISGWGYGGPVITLSHTLILRERISITSAGALSWNNDNNPSFSICKLFK